MKIKEKRSFRNQSLERALQIISAFTFESRKLTLTELSNKLDIPMTTTYRLALTLMDHGFLEFDQATKQYSLGLRLMEIGSIVYNSFSLGQIASSALNELLAKMGNKNVVLGIFRDDEIIYVVKKEDPRNPIKFATTEVGRHRPPHFGMFGLLFMAFMPDGEVERILKKSPLTGFTGNSIVRADQFRAKLGEVREKGYALDDGGAFEGLSGVAFPVRDGRGQVVAAVGVSFITSFVTSQELEYIIESVKEAAQKIEQQLPTMMSSGLPGVGA
jgi:IclR family transcriptional regulator, KDG regulon repressor